MGAAFPLSLFLLLGLWLDTELYRNKFCTWIMQIKADSDEDDKFCHRAAVKKLLEHKLFQCFLGSFWREPDKQNGEAALQCKDNPRVKSHIILLISG